MKQWYRITAPHYVAGLCVQSGMVTEAAPILNWCKNKTWKYVYSYFVRKKYEVQQI